MSRSTVRSKPLTERLVAWEWLVILAIAPALLFPTPSRLWVLSVVPLVYGLARATTGRFIPNSPLNVPMLLLGIIVILSAGVSFDPLFSLGKISGVALGMLATWAIARWTSSPVLLRPLGAILSVTGGGLAVVALVGTDWSGKYSLFQHVTDYLPSLIRGLPGAEAGFNANPVAGTLLLFVPLQLALATGRIGAVPTGTPMRSASRILHISCVAVSIGVLVLSQSRGAWGAAVAALGLWTAARSGALRMRTVLLTTPLVAGLLLSPNSQSMLRDISGPDLTGTVNARVELWSRAAALIQDYPLTGVGLNGFRRVLPVLYPAVIADDSSRGELAHSHNILLQTAVDLGVPGLVAYTAIWLLSFQMLMEVRRKAPESMHATMAGALALGLAAYFCFNMTDAVPLGSKLGLAFWLTIGSVASLHRLVAGRSGSREDTTKRYR